MIPFKDLIGDTGPGSFNRDVFAVFKRNGGRVLARHNVNRVHCGMLFYEAAPFPDWAVRSHNPIKTDKRSRDFSEKLF